MMRHIAVIDIGKTNAKLALVDLATLREIDVATRPNRVLAGPPWPHFDTEGIWQFLLAGLAGFQRKHGIDGISVTTHGACVALLDAAGSLAAPILDYEHDGPDTCAPAYDAIRPDFDETGSPGLPGGLNVGAQLFWQFRVNPGLRARVARIVTYPQYWAHRLTGIAAADVTSVGCHTDLWNPVARRPSRLVDRLAIAGKLAPVRRPDEVLGTVLPGIAAATGLPAPTPVVCGIHDSNASLYPHLVSRAGPFSVVSTGTWVVVMSVGGSAEALDPARDSLINVDANGAPVPSARFMGGRTYELVQRGAAQRAKPEDVAKALRERLMLLPSVVRGSGPFPAAQSRWLPAEPAPGSGAREVALSFHLALMTAECLTITGACGPVIVEGPFARNTFYCDMLWAATGRGGVASGSSTGTSIGAALLFGVGKPASVPDGPRTFPAAYVQYAAAWRKAVASRQKP